ncbi:MarR family transcriptional regulator [Demequina sp.]|uniref:MarR family winged helix-turn-helix transcriptional regulator n=1 Tax=Demequina sp. TaxID=2050685 RepID=UPI0025CBE874|nr:MarR family transcriptional regulator [Demequina sp.]
MFGNSHAPLGRGGTEPIAPLTFALLDTARITDYLRDACASGATMTAAQGRLALEVSASHFGVRPCEIAARLGVSRPAATQMIGRMEWRGLIARDESDLDERGVLIRLTPRGERECESIRRSLRGVEAEVVAAVGPRAMPAFVEALQSLANRTWLMGDQPGDARSIPPRFC